MLLCLCFLFYFASLMIMRGRLLLNTQNTSVMSIRKYTTTLLLICYVLLNITITNAQSIQYAYDEAGNRINRKTLILSPQQLPSNTQIDSTVTEDELDEVTILVYPNPTKGNIEVVIQSKNQDDNIQLNLFDELGHILLDTKAKQGNNPIPMINLPKGWYILRVKINNKWKEVKIIKQ